MKAVETAPHEFTANYIYDDYGLKPFFAIDSVVKQFDGATTAPVIFDGETWKATLYYQDSGIVNPGECNPQGTEFSLESMREFRVALTHADDPLGEQKANFHVSPRWQGMEVENDEGDRHELSIPDSLTEGINIRVSGSNIEFSHYEKLLARIFDALDINQRYVAEPHDASNIQDAERYVRLVKGRSGPVHARDGPISQMGHLLENDRSGYRKVVQNDEDERGRNVAGYYHTVTLGPKRVREAFPSHALPKEVKHYYAREAESMTADEALAHPKVGASYQVSLHDQTLGVDDDDLQQLSQELEETVLSVLSEANLSIQPLEEGGLYKKDAYFKAEQSDRDLSVTDLSLTEIEQKQESIVISQIADGLSPVEWESLHTLVTDGGHVSPADIAEENDRHPGSVRRALNRLPEMIEHDYGEVSLRSDYVAEMVHEAVDKAKNATRRAVEATARAKEVAERGADESMSAFMAWAATADVEVDDRREARMVIRMGRKDATRKIRRAFTLWQDSGRPEERFREAQIKFENGGYGDCWDFLTDNTLSV